MEFGTFHEKLYTGMWKLIVYTTNINQHSREVCTEREVIIYYVLYFVKAKFHYAILVADRSEAGGRPASSWNLAYH